MTWCTERGGVSSYTHILVCAASAQRSNSRTWPSPSGSLPVVRFSASPAWSSSLEMACETAARLSVVWRETPQTLLTNAEQSRPLATVPPQTYGTPINWSAFLRISERDSGAGPPDTSCAGAAAWIMGEWNTGADAFGSFTAIGCFDARAALSISAKCVGAELLEETTRLTGKFERSRASWAAVGAVIAIGRSMRGLKVRPQAGWSRPRRLRVLLGGPSAWRRPGAARQGRARASGARRII